MIDIGSEMLKQHFMRYMNTKQQLKKNLVELGFFSYACFNSVCIFKGKSIQLPQNEIDFETHSRLDTDQPPLVYIQYPKTQKG